MALIITPSEDPDITLDVKYAVPGDILTVLQVNPLVVGFPSAQPNPSVYSCRSLVNTRGVTDLSSAWANCTAITEFPLLDFRSCTNFEGAWEGCSSLTSFPANAFDTSNCTNFFNTWNVCSLSQQSVDNILVSIDTAGKSGGTLTISGGTSSPPSLVGWYSVASLQAKGWTVSVNGTPPAAWPPTNCNTNVQTYGVTSFANAWFNCQSLTSFPMMNTSNVTNFSNAWTTCVSLLSFPNIDTSNGTNFSAAWYNYKGFTFPALNFSKGTNFSATWYYASSITSFPMIDVSNGQDFSNCWGGCWSLKSFPLLDVSKGTNFYWSWYLCFNLTSFPALNLSLGTLFIWAWNYCTKLVDFPPNMFDNCQAVYFNSAWDNCALSQQSVDNILISINTAGKSNGTLGISGGTSSAPGSAGLAAKASLISRGWTITTN